MLDVSSSVAYFGSIAGLREPTQNQGLHLPSLGWPKDDV